MLYLEEENIHMNKKIISTKKAPKAIGPYSQAILIGNTLYCSGQIALNPKTGMLVLDNIEEETNQIMQNISEILKEAKMDFSNVVKCSIFMRDIRDYESINAIYTTYFKKYPPAREAIEVSKLPKNVNVEISVISAK